MQLKPVARTALTAISALLMATGPAFSAQAATGTFVYDRVDGTHGAITNPVNGVCYDFDSPAFGADNQTDTDAVLFDTYGCSGVSQPLPKRTGEQWGTYRAESVTFG
ncbi:MULTISPECIES: hypothetical protein [Streptomyces]|uniref:hypothetical protein n=1 Tax=Streptomyces TaxID=1883 RepID=UPI0016735D8F|nr:MULTISPECIES: hypothetical protein [Streptomyces]MBK3521853.1 hypothetical protein [Streptomyces sp. MBT70]GGR79293.1 hypothetical protein GCM10010236_37450 [Streptomyces eurythermus]